MRRTTSRAEADLAAQIDALTEQNQQLQNALDSRVVIEQAKGAVSARYSIEPDQAYELIRAVARNQRRKIHEVSREVVARGGRLNGNDTAPRAQPPS